MLHSSRYDTGEWWGYVCVCFCLYAHLCTQMVPVKKLLMAICWIDSYTLDSHALDDQFERVQPCICLWGIFLCKDQIQRNGPLSSTNC